MNLTKVHLFVLLLLALVLCSFFGGACGGSLEGYANNSDQDQYASYADMYSGNNTDKNKGDRKDNANDKPVSSNSMNDRNDDDDDQMSTKYAPYYRKDKRGDGIPASQIPPGTEDLYILKSKVVPPVCPVCPSIKCDKNSNKDKNEKCPPCPPCARCPEPAFECKKVPNYNRVNDDSMPYPVLNSFSQFGL